MNMFESAFSPPCRSSVVVKLSIVNRLSKSPSRSPLWRTPAKFWRERHTTGGTGAYAEAATVCTSGPTPRRWSCPTAATAGSASFWMANWQQCIVVGVLKAGQMVLVRITQDVLLLYENPLLLEEISFRKSAKLLL